MNSFVKTLTNKAVTWATDMLIRGRYELWIRKFGRTYADAAEKERRFANFKETFEFVRKHNRERTYGCTLGLNNFSDMSWEEFENTYCMKGFMNHLTAEDLEMIENAGREMPTSKAVAKGAWRTKGRSQQGSSPKGPRRDAKRRLHELRGAASNVKMS
ncbi:senescence-specific cysteine protease SAG39-like isoform X1 [Ananas comosus]|uniref:Actinidain n=1 Tax=Ananas comosus TaxID=4615 RepID=A0A199UT66_ANACO|nr:senescence-specific cysteine protease SAG39-like isoform X1 [Ananas comosus]OAY67830.1 Actinidain [Ananas comosus]